MLYVRSALFVAVIFLISCTTRRLVENECPRIFLEDSGKYSCLRDDSTKRDLSDEELKAVNLKPAADVAVAKGKEGLNRDEIEWVIRNNVPGIKRCYQSNITPEFSPEGRIKVLFLIGKDGLVKSAKAQEISIKSEAIPKCVVEHIQTMKFPSPRFQSEVEVGYPFVFSVQ